MVMNKFNNYTDNDLKTIVDGLSNDTVQCTIAELKELQSELINRRSEPQQIATISHLIMKQIASGGKREINPKFDTVTIPAVTPKPVVQEKIEEKPIERPKPFEFVNDEKASSFVKPSIAKIDQIRPQPINIKEMNEEDDEKFPVLRFLSLFFKIIGWIGVAGILGGYAIYATYFLNGNIGAILCGSGLSLIAAALFLLIFSALSENILWKLEIEKHLRKDK